MKRLNIAQPFLFAVFPILSLLASNIDFVSPAEALIPMALVIGATVVLFGLGTWLLRDWEGAGILVSLFWLLFFSFGRILAVIGGPGGGRERYLLAGCALLLILVLVGIVRHRGRLGTVASLVSVVGVALVAMPLVTIVSALLLHGGARLQTTGALASSAPREPVRTMAPIEPLQVAPPTVTPVPAAAGGAAATAEPRSATPTPQLPARPPDIYYIILDGYARSDVLADVYDLDNSAFIQGLEDRGFYVAGKSRANYCQTYLSLASSLNMTYLDDVVERVGEDYADRWPVQGLVRDNAVAQLLHQEGYTYATFTTGYAEEELKGADIYRTAPWSLSQFETGLVNTTPISPLIRLQYDTHRRRLLYALDQLPEMAETEDPVFVLAHIAAPHPPFVFSADGGEVTPDREFMFSDGSHYMAEASREEYVEGYSGQVTFISGRVLAMVDEILARSPDPPIIILQADHGPGSRLDWASAERTDLRERLSILNAYYLPYGGQERLYESITPVNTFRVIFDAYFGGSYGLLEDRSYYSPWLTPYHLVPVPPE